MKCPRIYVLLLGGIVMYLLGSCASNKEDIMNDKDASVLQGQDNEEQNAPIPTELPQPTPKASKEPLQSISEENSSQQEAASNEEESLTLSAEQSYKAILLGKEDFINSSEDGEFLDMVNIEDIWKTFTVSEMPGAKVKKFAIVDMDGDGEKEIVLWNYTGAIDKGFEILHYQNGKVYGYHFWYRALDSLKEDGTSIASSGAAYTSINKIEFLEKGYSIDTLYQSELQIGSDGIDKMQYYANGEICSEEEFNEALSRQNEKADVVWYDLTPENVELAFENKY